MPKILSEKPHVLMITIILKEPGLCHRSTGQACALLTPGSPVYCPCH